MLSLGVLSAYPHILQGLVFLFARFGSELELLISNFHFSFYYFFKLLLRFFNNAFFNSKLYFLFCRSSSAICCKFNLIMYSINSTVGASFFTVLSDFILNILTTAKILLIC